VLGHRELVIEVAALVAWIRAYQAGETVVAMVAFGLLMPLVMAIRRIRLGAGSPRLLGRRAWALQSANFWFFLVLLAAASLPGTFDVWRVYAPDAQALVVGAFWVGLAAALLVAFPRRRISATSNGLALLRLRQLRRAAPAHPGTEQADLRRRGPRYPHLPDPLRRCYGLGPPPRRLGAAARLIAGHAENGRCRCRVGNAGHARSTRPGGGFCSR
jgi:hypothetical protein